MVSTFWCEVNGGQDWLRLCGLRNLNQIPRLPRLSGRAGGIFAARGTLGFGGKTAYGAILKTERLRRGLFTPITTNEEAFYSASIQVSLTPCRRATDCTNGWMFQSS